MSVAFNAAAEQAEARRRAERYRLEFVDLEQFQPALVHIFDDAVQVQNAHHILTGAGHGREIALTELWRHDIAPVARSIAGKLQRLADRETPAIGDRLRSARPRRDPGTSP